MAASCTGLWLSTQIEAQRKFNFSPNKFKPKLTTTTTKIPNFFSKHRRRSDRRKKMKGCELCPGTARMYCESDQARLCFDCDAKVHGANFLVARHSRVLLCRSCQAPTPWKAAGPRLGPTVSVCDRCFAAAAAAAAGRSAGKNQEEDEGESRERRERMGEEEEADNGGSGEDEDDDDDDDDEREEDRESEEEEEEDDEEEGEEQVVPWTAEPPPVASSSSSEEESVGRIGGGLLKRMRACSQDQLPCSSSRLSYLPNRTGGLSPVRTAADDEATSDSFRPLKDRKKLDLIHAGSHGFSAISFGSARPPI